MLYRRRLWGRSQSSGNSELPTVLVRKTDDSRRSTRKQSKNGQKKQKKKVFVLPYRLFVSTCEALDRVFLFIVIGFRAKRLILKICVLFLCHAFVRLTIEKRKIKTSKKPVKCTANAVSTKSIWFYSNNTRNKDLKLFRNVYMNNSRG